MINELYLKFNLYDVLSLYSSIYLSELSLKLTVVALTASYFERYIYNLDFQLKDTLKKLSV